MISRFLQEQKRYSLDELCEIFGCSEEHAVPFIHRLKEFGILKSVKASGSQQDRWELADEDIEIGDTSADANEFLYIFTFVGIVVVAGRVLKCYPKYLQSASEPRSELRQILKVLEKYNSREQIIRMHSGSSDSQSFNLLAVLLFLLQDYYENGVYCNTEKITETNGSGEILWDRTVNDTFPVLLHNRPWYISLKTRKKITNEQDYFKRLHECILTLASKELKSADLLELFDISEIELSDESLDNFGDQEYVLYQLEKELATQFNTRRQLVLSALYSYISHSSSLYDNDCLSLFGTNNFNLVWEAVCADILDNKLQARLGSLKMAVPLQPEYDRRQKLIDLIEKPLWTFTGKTANDTLIPDLVTIAEVNQEYLFIIFDAKYYNARLEPETVPKGQPGIESITKQYLYQLAFRQFISDHRFSAVKNCFLMPSESDTVIDKGEVSLQMLASLGLQDISVRLLPASLAYECYLTGQKLDLGLLDL